MFDNKELIGVLGVFWTVGWGGGPGGINVNFEGVFIYNGGTGGALENPINVCLDGWVYYYLIALFNFC